VSSDEGIAAFVRARLDEDETAAKAVAGRAWYDPDDGRFAHYSDAPHIARHDPARALREVEAIRDIVAAYEFIKAKTGSREDDVNEFFRNGERLALRGTIERLASIWSDHPDYDPSWST
jgi:hypothetical protein